jgi:hypothetical protein
MQKTKPKAKNAALVPKRVATKTLDPELFAAVIARANKDHRSIAAVVEEALRAYTGVSRFTDWSSKSVTITKPAKEVI